VRPEKLILREPRGELLAGECEARIRGVVYNGSDTELSLEAGGLALQACCLNAGARTLRHQPGQRVIVTPPGPGSLIVLED